ncbi:MAG: neuraminidase-like domain-containing protein, partial [Bacteroidota bacterium]
TLVQSAWQILQQRRPELGKLLTNCENTNTTLPYIDLTNEVLEEAVVTQLNTQLSPEEQLPANTDRQTSGTTQELRAESQYLNKAAYEVLKTAHYPGSLPFHYWNKRAEEYLSLKGLTRRDTQVSSIGRYAWEHTFSKDEALISLGISTDLEAILKDNSSYLKYYGDNSTSDLENVDLFLRVTGLTLEELNLLLDSKYINPFEIAIVYDEIDSCNLDLAKLTLTSNELKRIHKFMRVQELLGWDTETLDNFLLTYTTSGNFTDDTFINMEAIQQLSRQLSVPVSELVYWYVDLSEGTFGDQPSAFDRVFPEFKPLVSGFSQFQLFAAEDQLDPTFGQMTASALGISPQELLEIARDFVPSGTRLQVLHFSMLYRLVSLLRALKMEYSHYRKLSNYLGFIPFVDYRLLTTHSTPEVGVKFVSLTHTINSRFSEADFSLLLGEPLTESSVSAENPSRFDQVRAIIYEKLAEKGIAISLTEENLFNIFLFLTNEEVAAKSVSLVNSGPSAGDVDDPEDFVATYWQGLLPGEPVDYLNNIDGDVAQVVKDLYSEALVPFLLLENEVIQFFADLAGLTFDVASVLLNDHLSVAFDDGETDLAFEETPPAPLSALQFFTHVDVVFVQEGSEEEEAHLASTKTVVVELERLSVLLSNLNVAPRHVKTVLNSGPTIGWPDFNDFNNNTSEAFGRLIKAYDLEDRLAVTDQFSVIDEIVAQHDSTGEVALKERLEAYVGWSKEDVSFLLNPSVLDIASLHDERWVYKLSAVFGLFKVISAPIAELDNWGAVDLDEQQSESIVSAVRATYGSDAWLTVSTTVQDRIRRQQRDALVAYLLDYHGFSYADDLFNFYLLDTQIEPCFQTSRIKLAISTVQTWVQRISMGLEPGFSFTDEDLDEWKWRKNYRVWEAARKVFLYPENWVEAELRDDKSPFFQVLEDELLQDEVTPELVEQAYSRYLEKVDEVGRLEISGCYMDEETNDFHVFGRTFNSPRIYYHRIWENRTRWTAWKKVDLDIEGDHLVPVVYNRRVYLFWPTFTEKAEKVTNADLAGENSQKLPVPLMEIKMAFSEYKGGAWQAKRISESCVATGLSTDLSKFFFKVQVTSQALSLDAYLTTSGQKHIGAFVLNDCNGQLQAVPDGQAPAPSTFAISNTQREYMKLFQSRVGELVISESIRTDALAPAESQNRLALIDRRTILAKVPSPFRITYPVTGAELLSDLPFFYEDAGRTFFVNPSGEVFTKEFLINLSPSNIKDLVENPVEQDPPSDDDRVEDPVGGDGSSGGGPSLQDEGGDTLGLADEDGSFDSF